MPTVVRLRVRGNIPVRLVAKCPRRADTCQPSLSDYSNLSDRESAVSA